MAKTKLPTMKRKLRRVAVLLILFIAATTVLTLSFVPAADDGAPEPNNLRHPRAAAVDDAALAYIPRRVLDKWSRREYLVVPGIPSMDNEERRTRRNLQRSTCWRFPGVATRANDFTGAMLVLYVLGRHPSHGYDYSAAMLEEAPHKRVGRAPDGAIYMAARGAVFPSAAEFHRRSSALYIPFACRM
ncbi:putative UDP-Gal or UDP-GlcNAc-dependent glycosyltransferase [Trypanosoma cruzi]|nr:putative UDP-Gal or UDP-GlcNAc-dependent glycosyltransferase [Trypanosoma cruzi]